MDLRCLDKTLVSYESFKNDAHHAEFELHKHKAEKAYEMYASDKSRNDTGYIALTMDLQQALQMPYIQAETVYSIFDNFGTTNLDCMIAVTTMPTSVFGQNTLHQGCR